MKRIAIFIDGTWNRPDAKHPTNVLRLARCVTHYDREKDIPQHVMYFPGVGSDTGNNVASRTLDRWFGGALGWGLIDLVEEAYRNLVFTYEPGDEIYLFGFSRGAFAARSLAGMIRSCGICPPEHMHRIPEAVQRYISRKPSTKPDAPESHLWREDFAPHTATSPEELRSRLERGSGDEPILLTLDYIGVWDTVKALGIPGFIPGAKYFNDKYSFHDDALSSSVLSARHAIATDERRKTFVHSPWSNLERLNGEAADRDPRFLQQWFPGNHGCVGGGGRRVDLSSITLHWIAQGAEKAGLKLSWEQMDHEAERRDPVNGKLDNKFGPVGLFSMLNFKKVDRNGPKETQDLSVASLDRLRGKPDYRPETLNFVRDEVVDKPEHEFAALRDMLVARDGGPTHELGSTLRPRDWEPPKDAAQDHPHSDGWPPNKTPEAVE